MTQLLPTSAAEWMIRMSSGALTDAEELALAQWIAEDSRRINELNEMAAVSRVLGRAVTSRQGAAQLAEGEFEIQRLRAQARKTRQRTFPGAAFTLAAAVSFVLLVNPLNILDTVRPGGATRLGNGSSVQTAIGQVQSYELPDTSSVTVAASTAVTVSFTDGDRHISLEHGEVFLAVAKDKQRPFVVTAGAHSVTVTGTRFNLDYDAERGKLEVAVEEGGINVSTNNSGKVEHLRAGDIISMDASGGVTRGSITAAQASAWRNGQVYFNQTQLGDALLQMNRYAAKPIVVQNESIAHLSLTGQFDTRDTATFIYVLGGIFGIDAKETDAAWVLNSRP